MGLGSLQESGRGPDERGVHLADPVGAPESTFFPDPLVERCTVDEWSRKYLTSTRDEGKFLAFLSIYGSNGVHLRELIELATLRNSVKPGENHWQLCGEVGPILRPVGLVTLATGCSFMNAFVREISKEGGIHALQGRLLSLDLIDVGYSMGPSIWRVSENHMISDLMVHMISHVMVPVRGLGQGILIDLLNVFLEMPGKDVSLFAERQRETFYNHARIFALEVLLINQTVLENSREYIVALILQLLTHRSQNGDAKLIQFVKEWPSPTNGSDWAIMLLWAEVKANIGGDSSIQTALNNRITKLLSWKGRRQRRANGLIGYLLVEWMKAAKRLQNKRLTVQIAKFAMDWVEGAWSSGSSIERTALCSVLATCHILDRSVLVSPRYYLLYGYHLSRAGHLEQAAEFLNSGILPYPPFQTSQWHLGYTFELISVLIRLGRRQEAAKWLTDIEKHTKSRFRDQNISLDRHAEVGILSGLYQAELLMAAGKVSLVTSRLESTTHTVRLMNANLPERTKHRGQRPMQDSYLRSLRLVLETRLLEIQTCQSNPHTALNAAKALVIEIEDGLILDQDMIQWIIQQLLTLSNRLVWTGSVLAASSLLESIVGICQDLKYSNSLQDLLPYAERRRATVLDFLVIDHTREDPNTVRHDSTAAPNKPPEDFDGHSYNTEVTRKKSSTRNHADVIERAPLGDVNAAVDDDWLTGSWSRRTSRNKNETESNSREGLNGLERMEPHKASALSTGESTATGAVKKPRSSNAFPGYRPASKQVVN